MNLKPIETIYKRHRFRSRAEARWAVFFDHVNMKWLYEPEGIEIDGTNYLPDFWLPESKTFFEVKGIMDDDSLEKINKLVDAGFLVAVGYPNGEFQACSDFDGTFALEGKSDSWFCRCYKCGKMYFLGTSGSWACPCCGAYDGDGHFTALAWGDEPDKFDLWDTARQARFEHGEHGNG